MVIVHKTYHRARGLISTLVAVGMVVFGFAALLFVSGNNNSQPFPQGMGGVVHADTPVVTTGSTGSGDSDSGGGGSCGDSGSGCGP